MPAAMRQLVLVGDDLEEGGVEALRQGQAWAERIGAALAVCHVVPDAGSLDRVMRALQRDSETEVAAALTRARQALENRVERVLGAKEPSLHLAVGSAPRVLLDLGARLGAVLIVVGNAGGRSPALQALLGSNAEEVVRHAEVPVLVARPSPSSGVVLGASDLADPSLPALHAAADESRRRGATFVAAHALDLAHPILSSFEPTAVIDEATAASLRQSCHETLSASCARFGAAARTEVVDGPAQRVIPELARQLEAELLVVATHGRTGLMRAALGSVAVAVLRRSPCSVLVVRATARP
jgi:nucleotide-binding universal stress UspA family protein